MKVVVEVGDERIPWRILRWWFDSEDSMDKHRFEGYDKFIVRIDVDDETIFEKEVKRDV